MTLLPEARQSARIDIRVEPWTGAACLSRTAELPILRPRPERRRRSMGDDEDRANDHEAAGDEWETITWNRWFELRAADGYGIWRRGAELDAEPIVRFNADEAGFEEAEHELRRRTRELRLFFQLPLLLSFVVAVGAVAYVMLTALQALWLIGVIGQDAADQTRAYDFGVLAQLANALWLGSLGTMLALWLVRRAREERPGD